MVQVQLASSLLGCISLPQLLGQPARNMPRRTLGRTRSRPRATCMHGRASFRPLGHRPSSRSKITCSTLFFMSVATLLRSGAKTGRSATHEHNRPGVAASLRGPWPSSTPARAMGRPQERHVAGSRAPRFNYCVLHWRFCAPQPYVSQGIFNANAPDGHTKHPGAAPRPDGAVNH